MLETPKGVLTEHDPHRRVTRQTNSTPPSLPQIKINVIGRKSGDDLHLGLVRVGQPDTIRNSLWYAQTGATDATITAFAADASKPPASRTYALKLVHRKDEIGAKERTQAAASTETSLRQKRRERIKAISDEALIDLDD
jgi:hypothetical protein